MFTASCATLILELVAGRLLAPFIGVSLYTWTSIIGVILAGVSLGSWLGGRLADSQPKPRTASLLFLLGGLSTLGVLGVVSLLGDGSLVRPVPLLARIFLLTTFAFLPPSLVLGMITPVVIRLLLPDVGRTGRIVGLVYALATLGSLVGNFLTGFVLVAYLPVTVIVVGVGTALLLCGLLSGWGSVFNPSAQLASSLFDPGAERIGQPRSARVEPAIAADWLRLPGNVRLACFTVVISSFCTMAIELAASRVLAPHVGVSLYSWTGIIGVVLAGIAVGNYLGGRLADRWPSQSVLGVTLFLSGLASLSILLAIEVVTQQGLLSQLDLMERILALTAAIFFAPVLLLGAISPQVIKLAVTDLERAGRVAGRIYAWSTAGAIVGTFATGWWLISTLGIYPLILAASLGLVALAIAVGRFWSSAAALAASVAVTLAAVYGLAGRGALESPCTLETNYFCIKVIDDIRDGYPVKALVLDHLIHSYVKLGDPSYLGYEHEQVQAEMTRFVAAWAASPRVLVIGGGGYTYPRWVEAFVPTASIEVVEIDPGVTKVAHGDLGLARDTRIVSHHLDGRQFVHELAAKSSYHLIVQDAVNDLSVPYHILTKEYNDDIRAILTDDGIYLLTVIDLYRDGQLLRSAIRTMMQTFPEVRLLAAQPSWNSAGSSVFVISGSTRELDLEEMRQVLADQGIAPMRTVAQPDDQLGAYVQAGPQIVLTDQYAPVDNLISILFRSRY